MKKVTTKILSVFLCLSMLSCIALTGTKVGAVSGKLLMVPVFRDKDGSFNVLCKLEADHWSPFNIETVSAGDNRISSNIPKIYESFNKATDGKYVKGTRRIEGHALNTHRMSNARDSVGTVDNYFVAELPFGVKPCALMDKKDPATVNFAWLSVEDIIEANFGDKVDFDGYAYPIDIALHKFLKHKDMLAFIDPQNKRASLPVPAGKSACVGEPDLAVKSPLRTKLDDFFAKEGAPKDETVNAIVNWCKALKPTHKCTAHSFNNICKGGQFISPQYMKKAHKEPDNMFNYYKSKDNATYNLLNRDADTRKFAELYYRDYQVEHSEKVHDSLLQKILMGVSAECLSFALNIFDEARKQTYKLSQDDLASLTTKLKSTQDYDKIVAKVKEYVELIDSIICEAASTGKKFNIDEIIGTDNSIFTLHGPNMGPYGNDEVVVIFKNDVMKRKESFMTPVAAMGYYQGWYCGNSKLKLNRTKWMGEAERWDKDGKSNYENDKFKYDDAGWEITMALEWIARECVKSHKTPAEVTLADIEKMWYENDAHTFIEGHIQGSADITNVEKVFVKRSVYNTLSDEAKKLATVVDDNVILDEMWEYMQPDNCVTAKGKMRHPAAKSPVVAAPSHKSSDVAKSPVVSSSHSSPSSPSLGNSIPDGKKLSILPPKVCLIVYPSDDNSTSSSPQESPILTSQQSTPPWMTLFEASSVQNSYNGLMPPPPPPPVQNSYNGFIPSPPPPPVSNSYNGLMPPPPPPPVPNSYNSFIPSPPPYYVPNSYNGLMPPPPPPPVSNSYNGLMPFSLGYSPWK